MRILQIISIAKFPKGQNAGGVYGAERSTIMLCRGLAQRGHQVCLACQPGAPLIAVAQVQTDPLVGFEVVPTAIGNPRSLVAIWRIVRLARQQRAEIIVGHDPRASRLATIAGRLLGLPVVATVRGLYKVKGYRRAQRIIAVSQGVRQHLLDQGVAEERIRVVYNGADLGRFVPPFDLSAAKREVGLENHALVVGIIGRLSPEKGHDWFLDAAAPIAEEFPEVCFLVVGDGPRRLELQEKAKQCRIESQTRFAGYQSDIVPWMAAMDILVLPSVTHEGFARVLIEAGAMQKPAITSPIGGNAEAIVDGETGLLVPVNDVHALSDALRQLLRDVDRRLQMGKAARQRIENHFTVPVMVEKTEAVYQELLG